ncbi:MAG: MFS transporter [Blastochloris sp.]|nr:MFS transporter [Blastochloris sp.]
MASSSVGYIALVRRNATFRRLWYGQIVSQLGDWLDSIAIFTLVFALTGSALAVSAVLLAEFLPPAIITPLCRHPDR